MAEGEIHKHLKKVALYFLKSKVTDLIATEVEFYNSYSVADAVGLNLKRKEVRVVEVKSTKSDFIRDKKLFNDKTSYFYHAHYSYIMCPKNIIQPEDLPYGYGLLWVDEYDNIEVAKKPIKNNARLKTLFGTTLKRSCRSLTNTYLFHEENKDNKDETGGKFKRNSEIKFISVPCPHCRKHSKELIHINKTNTIKCGKCKGEIDLTKAKTREITGFNKSFIKKINLLNDK